MKTITYEQADGVGWVTLNRPDVHNAFDEVMLDELCALWATLRIDDGVRCVVLTGAGDKAFCTGIDRSEIPADGQTEFNAMTWNDPGLRLGPKTNRLWKPVVAAVNGMACAGAFYLLGEVDFIIAADHATFFDPHVTYGMPAVYEPTYLIGRMPYGEVARMALLGSYERMSAARAYEVGFVTEVVAAHQASADAAHSVAASIAAQPATAVQATVRAIWAAPRALVAPSDRRRTGLARRRHYRRPDSQRARRFLLPGRASPRRCVDGVDASPSSVPRSRTPDGSTTPPPSSFTRKRRVAPWPTPA